MVSHGRCCCGGGVLLPVAIWVLTMLDCALTQTPPSSITKPSLRRYIGTIIGQYWSFLLLSVGQHYQGLFLFCEGIAKFDVTNNT